MISISSYLSLKQVVTNSSSKRQVERKNKIPLSQENELLSPFYSFLFTFILINRVLCCCSVAKSCPTLCDPIVCGLPGSSVHGISQATTLEWVAISSSRGSFRPKGQTHVSCIGWQILYHSATWKAQPISYLLHLFWNTKYLSYH